MRVKPLTWTSCNQVVLTLPPIAMLTGTSPESSPSNAVLLILLDSLALSSLSCPLKMTEHLEISTPNSVFPVTPLSDDQFGTSTSVLDNVGPVTEAFRNVCKLGRKEQPPRDRSCRRSFPSENVDNCGGLSALPKRSLATTKRAWPSAPPCKLRIVAAS